MRLSTSTGGRRSCWGSSRARRFFRLFREDAREFPRLVSAAADGVARPWREPRAAIPRRDAAGLFAPRTCRGETRAAVPDVLRAQRHGDGVLDAEGQRHDLRAVADSGAARA